ncbi:MAG: glycosyltransferase [Thermoanaerobaculia bacterium]
MRIAWFSPLPPAATGIADYSAELLPVVADAVDVELFVDDDDAAVPASLAERFPVWHERDFSRRAGDFDLCLYQLGNNAQFHGFVYRALLRRPGVVVLHEYMLHHLIQGLTLARGDLVGYLDEVRYAYGETAAVSAELAATSGGPFDIWGYPLFERAVDASLGVLVHNRTTRDRVLASRPAARVAVVPHHLSLAGLPDGDAASRAACRRALDLPADAFVVGCFGLLTPHKRIEVVLRAFLQLRRRHPDAVLLLAGEVSPIYDLGELLAGLPEGAVRHTGRLPLAGLLQAMVACDLAVNLRHPSGGETSGTLMRLLGLGRPVLVTHTGAFAELPEGCCARVPLDGREEELLTAYLERLCVDGELRQAMGRNARRHMSTHHTLEGSACGYVAFLQAIAAAPPEPFRPAPPLTVERPPSLRGRLLTEVGRHAAGLGVHEGDRELLRVAAAHAVELGLDPRASDHDV